MFSEETRKKMQKLYNRQLNLEGVSDQVMAVISYIASFGVNDKLLAELPALVSEEDRKRYTFLKMIENGAEDYDRLTSLVIDEINQGLDAGELT